MPSVAILGTRGYPSYYGGFETAVRRLAPYLVQEGWDVTVYSRPGATKRDDTTADRRVRSVVTRGMEHKSLSTLTFGFTSAVHVARTRPDVALVMNVANGYWLPILRARRIPALVNVDGIEWDRAKWGRLAKRVFHRGAQLTARFGDELVFDAEAIGDRWQREFGRQGVFIPYGGDEPAETLPIEPGLSHRAYVLMVARFVPENTVPEFFRAAEILGRTVDVVIVGSAGYGGELDEKAKALADSHPRVHWLGHIHDDRRLHSLWQHAGVYFHGHSVGGTNPALVQAMACGAPVIARDTVYNREVLGPTAEYVQPAPSEIVRAIHDVMESSDRQQQMSSHNIARAREHYSWELVNERYERTLRRLSLA